MVAQEFGGVGAAGFFWLVNSNSMQTPPRSPLPVNHFIRVDELKHVGTPRGIRGAPLRLRIHYSFVASRRLFSSFLETLKNALRLQAIGAFF